VSQVLRQSTQVIVVIGPFVDVGDGFTPETGITLGAADEAEILKANTSTTTDISGATWAAITGCDGYYALTLTTSLTDTVGPLTVMVNDDSVCLPVFARFQVIEEAAYDAMYAASADPKADVNVASIDANAITATAIEADAITAAKIADGAIDAATFAAGAINAAAIANGAIDAATFAADVDAEILSYLVDDATRVDASALNTLSGHDPGETIAGATDLGTGAGLTSLASAASLATVAGFVDTEVASILAAVDTEVAAIKAQTDKLTFDGDNHVASNVKKISDDAAAADALESYTDGSALMPVNNRPDYTGAVVDDAGNTASTFVTDRTETADDHWNGSYLRFTSGDLLGQVRKVTAYDGTTKAVTVTPAFTAEPADGDDFDLVNE